MRTYYSPEFYVEMIPRTRQDASFYYREYYYDERYGSKDYYWKSFDESRNVYAEEHLDGRNNQKDYYTNEDTRVETELTIEVYLIAIFTGLGVLLLFACICRLYCVARRLR